jgi:hypothetical protein
MMNEQTIMVEPAKVRERVDSYLTNRGYRIERMITSERFGIPSTKDIPAGAMAVYYLVVGLAENDALKKLSVPIDGVYAQGRRFFAEASVLTPRHAQLSEENEREIENMQKVQQQITKEELDIRAKHNGLKRWWLLKKNESLRSFCEGVLRYTHSRLPQQVSKDVSLVALNNLYGWLQIGEEDSDSKKAKEELEHPFDLLTEEQIRVLKIRSDLYKIKNHTAIVCLDQLRQDGLTLDAVVTGELDRIPREYLTDVASYGKLRNGSQDSFGAGLFN